MRFNGEKHELWSHYIAFELSYVERLRKRSAALGTPSPEVELAQVAVEAARAAFRAVAVEGRVNYVASMEKCKAQLVATLVQRWRRPARAAAGDALSRCRRRRRRRAPKRDLASTAARRRVPPVARRLPLIAAARALEALDATPTAARPLACAVKAARVPLDARSSAARAAAVAHARGVQTTSSVIWTRCARVAA